MGTEGSVKIQTEVNNEIKAPGFYKVLLYNDDFTTMEFVVELLETVFSKSEAEAFDLMMSVHHGSFAVAGVYPKDIAKTKAAISVAIARKNGYPLKVEAVPE